MKIIRFASVLVALFASLHVSPSVQADEPSNAALAVAKKPLSIDQVYEGIRADMASKKFKPEALLDRIDQLVKRIDAELEIRSSESEHLVMVRNATLAMRAEVSRFAANNGSQLVQITTAPPVGELNASVGLGQAVVDSAPLNAAGTLPSFGPLPAISGPIGGGASVGTGVSGGGLLSGGIFSNPGLLSLGGIAAGIAVPVAVSNDDDEAIGPIASAANP